MIDYAGCFKSKDGMVVRINFIFILTKEKASELYDAMAQLKSVRTSHKGRNTDSVGLRQRQRHIKEIR